MGGIVIILTTSIGYCPNELAIFRESLIASGFVGSVVVLSDDSNCLTELSAEVILDKDNGIPINSRRYLAYRDFLKGVTESVVITDIRDVTFQKNPSEYMPIDGVNVFEEANRKKIMECGFNSSWMNALGVDNWDNKPIICAGTTSGTNLYDYCTEMWDRLVNAPKYVGIDQAVHNDLIYSGFTANIHKNEDNEVYTVGHFPLESVKIENGFIVNKNNKKPCMVHMYDRHVNLTASVMYRLGLDMKIFKSTLKGAMV